MSFVILCAQRGDSIIELRLDSVDDRADNVLEKRAASAKPVHGSASQAATPIFGPLYRSAAETYCPGNDAEDNAGECGQGRQKQVKESFGDVGEYATD